MLKLRVLLITYCSLISWYTSYALTATAVVDSSQGSDTSSCGNSESPCKTISAVIRKPASEWTVLLKGNYLFSHTLYIDKRVTIKSYHSNRRATIKDANKESSKCAFTLTEGAVLRVTSIDFESVGVACMKGPSEIFLDDCIVEHVKGDVVGVSTLGRVSISLLNTSISESVAVVMSSFERNSPDGSSLSIKNCSFINISKMKLVGLSLVQITRSVFRGDIGGSSRPIDVLFSKVIEIRYCNFFGQSFNGPIQVSFSTTITIAHCNFWNISSQSYNGYNMWGQSAIWVDKAKNVKIEDCNFKDIQFKENPGSILLSRIEKAVVSHCVFANSSSRDAVGGAMKLENGFYRTTNYIIHNCVFVNNFANTKSGYDSGGCGGAIHVHKRLNHKDDISVRIDHCQFVNNTAQKVGGAIYAITDDMKPKEFGIQLSISNSVLSYNEASVLGKAVYFKGNKLDLRNISVDGPEEKTNPHLYLEGEHVKMEMIRIKLQRPSSVQSNMALNGLRITSSTLLMKNLKYLCPINFNVEVKNMSYAPFQGGETERREYTFYSLSCATCPPNQYALSNGVFHITTLPLYFNPSDISTVNITNHECLPCPAGATCNGDIKALSNYWGHTADQNHVGIKFTRCPLGYCCSTDSTPCVAHNTCSVGRTGILCGSCGAGYAQSFVTKDCILKAGISCSLAYFVAYFLLTSLIYTIALTFIPSIIELLKGLVSKLKRNKPEDKEVQPQDSPLAVARKISETDATTMPFSAYITMVFLYFQIAGLIHVVIQADPTNITKADENKVGSDSKLGRALVEFFNFRFSFYREVCPKDDLTFPEREFISLALKLCSIANLIPFIIIWKCSQLVSKFFKSAEIEIIQDIEDGIEMNEVTQIMNSQGPSTARGCTDSREGPLIFTLVIKLGFIKLLKLNYTALCTFAFQMVHCVPIGGTYHLFVYGDQQCFTWWQYVVAFVAIPFVVLFPISFGVSLSLLKHRKVSTNMFLLSSVLPPYAAYLLLRYRNKDVPLQQAEDDGEEEVCRVGLLEPEEMLFCESDGWNAMSWPVVQLYRNLVIVLLNTFVVNPTYRCLSFIIVHLLFVIHDRNSLPYKHPYLNGLQLLSSRCLLVITVCNIPASFATNVNVMNIPRMTEAIAMLKWVELAMYFVVPFSLVVWKAWEFLVNRRIKKDK